MQCRHAGQLTIDAMIDHVLIGIPSLTDRCLANIAYSVCMVRPAQLRSLISGETVAGPNSQITHDVPAITKKIQQRPQNNVYYLLEQ